MMDIIILSLIYMLLISIIYFSKKKLDTKDNRIYKIIIIINILGLVLDLLQYLSIKNGLNDYIIYTFSRLFLLYVNAWTFVFSYYVVGKNTRHSAILKYILFFLFSISSILVFILPFKYYFDGVNSMYTYGMAIDYLYVIGNIYLFICFISIFLDFVINKNRNLKQYVPLFFFVIGGILEIVIQKANPSLIILSSVETFITILMYFFIENPDVAMIAQLNFAREQADRANNAKSDFLSSMSHEIRTPLNAILGFSQALSEEDIPDQAKDEVKDIMMASETLLELVNGILDISKIEANKLEIVNVEYDFMGILDELVSLTRARLGEKPLDFRYNFAPDLPKYVYGDKVRVKQIILNLLTNAVKYTKEGWIEFNVNCIRKGNVSRIIIAVEDSGIGIKPESINKLFSKFERLDVEKNNTIEGTGLGLAITKKLIDLMGGKIIVQSNYGEGSKFTIALDQKIVENPTNPALIDTTVETKKIDLTNKRILIVDDNKINLKVATRLLSDYKCIIETMESGIDCVSKHEIGAHYDLILMDDMMPKMSGVETFHKLQSIEGFNTPVVALTANAISGMREKYLAEGFNDYLSKPIDKEELRKVLTKFLG